ncbi:MAG: AAA family ATPase [Leptospiraceae bacterium]
MKPLKLVLENFGPFLDSQMVDFTELDEIFLISGPTGSGKTSLFDGMVYALYGELPGTRDPLRIKSNFSDEQGTARVILDFRARGKVYRIQRSLTFSRNRKGELNPRKDQSIFELRGEDKKEVPVPEAAKLSDLNRFVVELLHLSREEFSKIILLPQGEFQKFLEEDSKGRQEIMRKLFPTEEHLRITDRISERRKEKSQKIKTAQSQLEELEEALSLENAEREEELSTELETLEKERIRARANLEASVRQQEKENALIGRFEEQEKYESEERRLASSSAEMEKLRHQISLAEKANSLIPYLQEIDRLDLETRELEKRRVELENEKDSLLQNESFLEKEAERKKSLSKKWQSLQAEMGQLQPLIDKERNLELVRNQLESLDQEEKKNRKSIEENESELKKLREQLEQTDQTLEDLDAAADKSDGIYELLTAGRAGLDHLKSISAQSVHLLEQSEKKERTNKNLLVNEAEYRKWETQKNASVAANLAQDLISGQACPVCGSTEHPGPAHLQEEVFTEEEKLEAARTNLEHSRADLAAIDATMAAEIAALMSELDTFEIWLDNSGEANVKKPVDDEAGVDAPGQPSVRDSKKLIETMRLSVSNSEDNPGDIDTRALKELNLIAKDLIEQQNAAVDSLAERLNQAQTAKSKIQEMKTIRKQLQSSEVSVLGILEPERKKLQKLQTEISSVTASLKSMQEDLGGRKDIQQSLESLKDESAQIETDMASIDRMEREHAEASSSNQANLKSVEEQLKQASLEKKDRLKSLEKQLKKAGFESMDQVRQASMDEKEFVIQNERLQDFDRNLERVQTILKNLKKELFGKTRPDAQIVADQIQQIGIRVDALEKEIEGKRSALEEITRQKKRRSELQERIKNLQTQNRALFQLADDLAGFNRKKVNFENFVLNYYLRDVTDHANHRLSRLSDGRYALIVNADIEHQNRQTGLNLDIMDAHTGVPRSVKSLSGGEKFLASLSLALGLADVIQERAGTIEMDSLFLDEGFGTLDEEALNRAMNILEEIRENRMVGIISHVSELKRTIPCQLHLKKTSSGSSVHLVRH